MTGAGEVSLVDLLADPAVRADPYPTFAHVQSLGRLVPTTYGAFLVTRHADALTVLRDPRFSSHPRHRAGYDQLAELARQVGLGELQALFERILLVADPPDHTRLRRIVNKAFTPRAAGAMRPRVAAVVDRLIDAVAADGGADLVEALAFPLPVTVISELLGVPQEDHAQLRSWTAEAVRVLDPSDDVMGLFPAADAIRAMRAYFDDLARRRRRDPGDDLLSALIAAEDEGDRLTHDELLDTTVLLFGAGHETTVNLIAGGVLDLVGHPDELRRLRADPSLVGKAVEELLRYGPPVQLTARATTTAVEVAGERLPAGTELVVLIAAANRDPGVFVEPDRLDVGRTDNPHLSFGAGPHHCLGAPLARVEAQEAIGALLSRFSHLALADDAVAWKPTSTIRGPARLVLEWRAA